MPGAKANGGTRSAAEQAAFQRAIEDAKARRNLSDVVSRHTKLRKRGGRELVGLCPFHQERSPSFEVNDTKGTYYCHGCGVGGDHFTFLTQKDGLSFKEAFEALTGDAFPTVSEEERARRKAVDENELAERIALARWIWSRSTLAAGTPAEVYARSRGIFMPLPQTVRFVMTPRWRDRETGEVGRDHPAMACALQDVTGRLVGVQCIFLADGGRRKYARTNADGSKAKAKLTFGILAGSAFRLGRPLERIMTCEGPEDALTLRQEMGETVWAACGTSNLSQMMFPPTIRHVCVGGDNGDAGERAVRNAIDWIEASGRTASSVFPLAAFKDFNDQHRGVRK
ncbi:CHC2 zinc finger domain-containing protein [Sphingobium sp. CAP-1]|uniref:CHC2 zinc finger domain-containing protein n=1 Tax=Sphingobium sp. CAP-1 TaxID=2676077 RepID=UPI0012BB43B5|nr:CHC2 zinc finger domain-containing protein [Sphingobium sp. CAP-1]QGP80018.1 DNA primase [Sphingobium sp. CAP-1]